LDPFSLPGHWEAAAMPTGSSGIVYGACVVHDLHPTTFPPTVGTDLLYWRANGGGVKFAGENKMYYPFKYSAKKYGAGVGVKIARNSI